MGSVSKGCLWPFLVPLGRDGGEKGRKSRERRKGGERTKARVVLRNEGGALSYSVCRHSGKWDTSKCDQCDSDRATNA